MRCGCCQVAGLCADGDGYPGAGNRANAVVFSVLNALVLRPINVPHAENLFMVQRFQYPSQSYPDYLDLRDRTRTFESVVAFEIIGPVGVDTGGNPSTAWPYMASGNYFDALGVQPYLGRFFHASDEKGYNSAPYVVLTYAYWHSHFHDDKGVIGRPVLIDKHQFTIIGVAPPGFRGTELFFAPAFWMPIVERPTIQGGDGIKYRGNHSSMVLGRLKPGVESAGSNSGFECDWAPGWRKRIRETTRAEVLAGSSGVDGRHTRWSGAGVHGGLDAACGAHSAGGVREPG